MKTISLEQDIDRVTADTAAARSLFIFLIVNFAFSWLLLGLAALSANGAGGSVLLPALAHAAINAYALPWNTAVYLLPEGNRGIHLQIPVTIVLVLLAVLLVLLTRAPRPARNSKL